MKPSEIILISASALAIAYGVYEFVLKSGKGGKIDHETGPEDISAFTAGIMSATAGSGGNQARNAALLAAIEAPLRHDPFLYTPFQPGNPGSLMKKDSITTMEGDKYIYSSFLGAGNSHFAIINGLDYAKGDRIDAYTVEDITQESVILSHHSGLFRLPIKEEDHE